MIVLYEEEEQEETENDYKIGSCCYVVKQSKKQVHLELYFVSLCETACSFFNEFALISFKMPENSQAILSFTGDVDVEYDEWRSIECCTNIASKLGGIVHTNVNAHELQLTLSEKKPLKVCIEFEVEIR